MRIAVGGVVFMSCLLIPRVAAACTCLGSVPPCQSVWQSDGVIEATVASIETVLSPPVSEKDPRYNQRLVRLQDVRRWTGDSTDIVMTGMDAAVCGYDFRVGTRYLIAFHKRPDGGAETSICTATQPAESPGPLKSYLETLSRPSRGATISGQIQAWKGPGRTKIGIPLPGVKLVLTGPVRQTVESDAKGAFAFERLPVGEYLLTPEMPPRRPDLMSLRPVGVSLPHTHACSSLSLIALSSSQPVRPELRRD